MTLNELIAAAQEIIAHHPQAGEHPVEISTCNPAIGPSAGIPVRSIAAGFDWNSGRVLVTAETSLLAIETKPGERPFEEVEVVGECRQDGAGANITLRHAGGYVGPRVRTPLPPGARLRLIPLHPRAPGKPVKKG